MTRAQAEALIAYVAAAILADQPGAGAGAWQRMEAARAAFLATIEDPAPRFIVHHMLRGGAACSLPGLPREWPPGHIWSAQWADVTCPACKEKAP